MIFDHAQEYSLQLSSQSFATKLIDEPTGIFHCRQWNNNPTPSGDVLDMFPEFLGAGKYQFVLVKDQT
jgi:hypothetical protein